MPSRGTRRRRPQSNADPRPSTRCCRARSLGGIDPNVVSLCNETLHGEWHDDAFANWGCYRGVRDAPFNAPCSGPSCRTWGTAGADAADVALMVGIHSTGSGAASASGGAAAASGNPGLMSSADAAAALEAKVNSAQRLWRASSSQMPAAKRDRILEMLRRAPREAPASAKAAAAQAAATAPGSAGAPAAAAAVALLRAADRAAAEGAAASAPRNGSADRALLASLGVPASLDWRTHKGGGWLSPVRSQSDGGSCGSCYALATLAMVEARTRIASGGKQSEILSPLDVVGCSPYSQGCNGGFPYLVGKYGIDFGYAARNSAAILAQFWRNSGAIRRNSLTLHPSPQVRLGGVRAVQPERAPRRRGRHQAVLAARPAVRRAAALPVAAPPPRA